MSEILKAADLNRHHLGRVIRVSKGDATFTDMLSGVSHEADLIDERHITQEVPEFVLGRIATSLTFANAGPVQIAGSEQVEVLA